MTEAIVAIPVAPVVSPIVTAVIVTIVAALVPATISMIGLRRSDDAANERERKGRSSKQTFPFDLPTDRTNRLGEHYRAGRLSRD